MFYGLYLNINIVYVWNEKYFLGGLLDNFVE